MSLTTTAARASTKDAGFTLIELMIAVAIIGILATAAIAGFQGSQLRSKFSEAKTNLSSVRQVQISYSAEAGAFVAAAPSPAIGIPNAAKMNWAAVRNNFSSVANTGFDALGWKPEGGTFFDYDSAASLGAGGPRFTAAAYGDTDGDGAMSVVMYTYPDNQDNVEPCGLCGPLGVNASAWDPVGCAPILNSVARVPSTSGCGFAPADDY